MTKTMVDLKYYESQYFKIKKLQEQFKEVFGGVYSCEHDKIAIMAGLMDMYHKGCSDVLDEINNKKKENERF